MEFRLDDETFDLAITGNPETGCEVTATPTEGEPSSLSCRLVPVGHNAYLFSVDAVQYRAHAVQGPEGWHVSLGGEAYLVVPPEVLERQRRRGGQVDAEQHVTPPMPGQVVKISVAVGDVVAAGQAVIVLSAMKMETTLCAPHAGTVMAITTQVGAQVMPGDRLIDIEEPEASA